MKNNKVDYKNLKVNDRILVWATVTHVYRSIPERTKNDVEVKLENGISDPSLMCVELATCDVVQHVAYKNVWEKLKEKIKSKLGLSQEEKDVMKIISKRY